MLRQKKSLSIKDKNSPEMTGIILVISAYIAAQILSDITSLKIITFVGFSMDAGTLIYPITFTLRDLVHKAIGRKGSLVVIITAAAINLLMAGLFWLVARFPYDVNAGSQPDWDAVLSPVWRIVTASIIAEVVSEIVDTEAYHLWVNSITRRYQWGRVLFSNALSVPLDSLIFCWLAFGTVFPAAVVWSIFMANIIVKGGVTLAGLPLIYLIKSRPEDGGA